MFNSRFNHLTNFLSYQIKAGLAPPDDSVAGLASSFKDKVKIEKKHGTGENQPDQKKKVKVEEGGKIKSTGGKINKKTSQTATLVSGEGRVVSGRHQTCVFNIVRALVNLICQVVG